MSDTYGPLLIGRGKVDIGILPKMANRHGLVAGATGTGKTVTLRVLAEHFSSIGVPIFMADVKGDLSGICQPGGDKPKIAERVEDLDLKDFKYRSYPVVFWDVEGVQGHPVRTTISEMGPLLLARLLNLNDTQSGVLSIIFKIADDNGLLLLDLKDLRSMVQFAADNAERFRTEYGNISSASAGAIQRSLLALEQQGADKLFGEPALDLEDLLRTSATGEGIVNILVADELIQAPSRYATFLLWLLSDLFERLPEVGDLPKPRLIFFFDEAHLLFEDAPRALVEKIEQVVRLIRSKGVGVYFVTQNPLDLPDRVLGQLGNRVQHALRAFSPRDQKTVKAAAETFRANPKLDAVEAITELGVGEALISVLDEKGIPTRVERAWVLPPQSRLTPLTPEERDQVIKTSKLYGVYEKTFDRESAYELLRRKTEALKAEEALREAEEARRKAEKKQPPSAADQASKILIDMGKSAARSAGTQIGRQILRGIFGTLFGKK